MKKNHEGTVEIPGQLAREESTEDLITPSAKLEDQIRRCNELEKANQRLTVRLTQLQGEVRNLRDLNEAYETYIDRGMHGSREPLFLKTN